MADKYEYVPVAPQDPAVLTFSNLFEAKAVGKKGKEQGAPKFSATFEADPKSVFAKQIANEAIALAKRTWPGRDLKELKFPWAQGDALADKRKREIEQAKAAGKEGKDVPRDREFSRGKVVITARTQKEFKLSVVDGRSVIELTDDARRTAAKGKFYPGVEVLGAVTLHPYDEAGANPAGICAYLDEVVSLNKGAKIEGLSGSRPSTADTFKGYLGTVSDYDPTGGAGEEDDEIPF